jgi:chromosome segregation protein
LLKLKKIQILGFKSFCDKTEVALPGNGIAVVVGPNGCGKSNILDGVTWVLGEQSAKTLRGGKMEDVIFAGTRERRALGMAEVSITLIDPEVYGSGPLVPADANGGNLDEPEIVIRSGSDEADWDEEKLRAARAEEVEQIIAEAQPGQVIGQAAEGRPAEGGALDGPAETGATTPSADGVASNAQASAAVDNSVVLKIRRRKFHRTPQHGEIVVTRRLFRTGDSEYLLNGKLCRLSDVRDIFMGTGLGPESYAIIGQERIGQLLSSKPHDRRAIIEEAAGITRFKTKKRLAELRLEQAKQNLARVNDIFEEVTRQMASLKRQAAKAERYGALRDELRVRLRVVLASRIGQMDAEQAALQAQISELTASIDERGNELEGLQAEYSEGQARGYEIDTQAKEASAKANESAVELERARTRQHSNEERIADLNARTAAGMAEREQSRQQLDGLTLEREQHRSFLATAASEAAAFREEAQARQAEARQAASDVAATEQRVEAARRQAMHLLSLTGQARNQTAQAEESLAALERDAERLASETSAARRDLAALGAERGQVSMRFESASDSLKRLEAEIAELRATISVKRNEETETRQRGNQLRSEKASLTGRRNSLDALLREHSYSTDTVRKLFRAQSLGGGLKPVGTLADFLEVGEQYESVVDEFLRDELNYIVVKSWDAAHEGMRLLKSDVDGRATFLVHPNDSQAKFSFAAGEGAAHGVRQGVVGLKDCIRVLDGFGKSLEVILPKLRDGYVTADSDTARTLALENPDAFFLSPSGECFHNVTVTGGKPRAEGPLALKRELREAQAKLDKVEAELAQAETAAATLNHEVQELTRQADLKTEERRIAERESAHQSAALRQMDGEVQRLERRLADWTLQTERNRSQRDEKDGLIARKREETASLEQQHEAAEASLEELQLSVEEVRAAREEAQQAAAQVSAELAGLEERRRGAEQSFGRIDRMFGDLERRIAQLDQQLAAAAAEQAQRLEENAGLAARQVELKQVREAAQAQVTGLAEEAKTLRARLAEAEGQLKTLRAQSERERETRAQRSTASARLAAELEHVEAAAVSDLGVEASALRDESGLQRLAGPELASEESACRELKGKLEAMGPVNMMALEEYKETEQRHGFLETQRKDLLDSIENTHLTIRELDGISRTKFDEAFEKINRNFAATFSRLFGGGQAFMRLTDEENAAESGIDIVASPPGKKLQNVFLLSGGEKALTALSLLMGIFEFQPAPFCVLDEVDAPLDETNVGRLADMLRSMAVDTQFVMVTHSKRMMSAADMIYGVTMQEPGVSKVVSVRLGSQDRNGDRIGDRRATA